MTNKTVMPGESGGAGEEDEVPTASHQWLRRLSPRYKERYLPIVVLIP